jgi:AraC-like DNA-binding protein
MASKMMCDDNAFSILALSTFSDLQKNISKKRALIYFTPQKQIKILNILNELIGEYNSKGGGRETAIQCYLTLFLNEICRELNFCDAHDGEGAFSALNILNYICEHYNEKLTLNELAERCFYHPKYFSRIFKKYYGVTVSAYIQSVRLNHGKQLLTDTDMPIEQIAYEIGYTDKSSFYRHFKKEFNLTPKEVRVKK